MASLSLELLNQEGSALQGGDKVDYDTLLVEHACGDPRGDAIAKQLEGSDAVAVLGSVCSSSISRLHVPIPVFASFATSVLLGDREVYPHVVRVPFPDDITPTLSLLDVLGVRRVTVVCINDLTVMDLARRAIATLERTGILCTLVAVADNASSEEMRAVLNVRDVKATAAFVLITYLNIVWVGDFWQSVIPAEARGALFVYAYVDEYSRATSDGMLGFRRDIVTNTSTSLWTDFVATVNAKITDTAGAQAALNNFYVRTAFDAAQLMAFGLTHALATNPLLSDRQEMRDALVVAARSLQYDGVSGHISYSHDYGNNRRPSPVTHIAVMNTQQATWVEVGHLPLAAQQDTVSSLTFTALPMWPSGKDHAPLACPRGTYGKRQSQGVGFECVACPAGQYADQLDSSSCHSCPEGTTCPFASPAVLRGDKWRVPTEAEYPKSALTLGTREQRVAATVVMIIMGFVTCVGVALVALLPYSTNKFAFFRPIVRNLFFKLDLLFDDLHFEAPHVPLSLYPSVLGGMASVATVVVILCSTVFILWKGYIIDRFAVEYHIVPGLWQFHPKPESSLSLRFYAVGMDTGAHNCPELCALGRVEFASSPTTDWETMCFDAPDKGGCGLIATPSLDASSHAISSFWASARLHGTGAHAWQVDISSTFRSDGTRYMSGANVSAANDHVLAGPVASTFSFELRPTKFEAGGDADFGFVPFVMSKSRGSQVDGQTLMTSHAVHGTSLNTTWVMSPNLNVFTETAVADSLQIFADIIASAGIVFVCMQVAVVVGQYWLRRYKPSHHVVRLVERLGLSVEDCNDGCLDDELCVADRDSHTDHATPPGGTEHPHPPTHPAVDVSHGVSAPLSVVSSTDAVEDGEAVSSDDEECYGWEPSSSSADGVGQDMADPPATLIYC